MLSSKLTLVGHSLIHSVLGLEMTLEGDLQNLAFKSLMCSRVLLRYIQHLVVVTQVPSNEAAVMCYDGNELTCAEPHHVSNTILSSFTLLMQLITRESLI